MNPTRRDVLKIAAALPTIGAALSRSDDLAELAKPVDVVPALPDNDPDIIFDAPSFAIGIANGSAWRIASNADVYPAAKERAAYTKARYDLIQAMPDLVDKRLPVNHPFVLMDECMWSIANESYDEGVRAGAAYERLRQAAIGPTQTCPTCDGLGLVNRQGKRLGEFDRPHPNDVQVCPECKSNGVVAADALKGRRRS